jgi:hypothetical protein
MAYRSFREVLAGSTPASIRRLQSNVVTQTPAQLSSDWLKFKNPEAPAVRREAEEVWAK